MSSNFGRIPPLTSELAALDHFKKSFIREYSKYLMTCCQVSDRCPLGYLLAHLSRRLTGEIIGYQWSGVRRFTFSNIFSKTAWPIKAKFYVEPPWVGGMKVCSQHLGHMTKMAAMPMYGKNPSGRFSRNLVCSIGDSSPS